MQTNMGDANSMLREGEMALRRRDPLAAARLFSAAMEAGAIPPPWIALARAHRALGDHAAEEAAIDRALALDTRDIRALIMKAECLAARGREREAVGFYQAAGRAGRNAADLPPGFASELWRAEGAEMKLQRKFEDALRAALAAGGFPPGELSREIEVALDILMGRARMTHEPAAGYIQEPTSFFYPGLPQRQYYERSEFGWIAALEAATDDIRAELEAVLADDELFAPYVIQAPDQPANHHALMNDPSWSAFFLMKGGAPVADHADRCPRTMAALAGAPLPRIRGQGPNVLFSLLRPGAHIPPHSGIVNTQLICHLPLVVPGDCALRVGGDIRAWEAGKTLIFDDSIEHEAWNRSEKNRVVLLFEIWRPEIGPREREALTLLFEAVQDYGKADISASA
jgi:aspartyl/asparaginyl beta-hydroxylase (cupin superfamily)